MVLATRLDYLIGRTNLQSFHTEHHDEATLKKINNNPSWCQIYITTLTMGLLEAITTKELFATLNFKYAF